MEGKRLKNRLRSWSTRSDSSRARTFFKRLCVDTEVGGVASRKCEQAATHHDVHRDEAEQHDRERDPHDDRRDRVDAAVGARCADPEDVSEERDEEHDGAERAHPGELCDAWRHYDFCGLACDVLLFEYDATASRRATSSRLGDLVSRRTNRRHPM